MNKCKCGKKLPKVKTNEIPYQYCSLTCKKQDQRESLARLKAAAPKLLKSLHDMLELSQPHCSDIHCRHLGCNMIREAWAAIAKAEGV